MRHHSMLRWPARFLAGTFGWALLTNGMPLRAADVPVVNAPAADEIARWVQELDADSFVVREQASTKLREAGPAAVDQLAQAVAGDSPESAARASTILQRIAAGNDERTLNLVDAALQKLGSKRKSVLSIAADIKQQQQKFKHTRAVALVRSLGGGLAGNIAGEHQAAIAGDVSLIIPGPLLIEEEVEIAPAIAIEDLPARLELPAIEEPPPPPKRGLLGLLAKLIVPAVAPAPPAEFFPVPADIPPDAVPPPPADLPDLIPVAPRAEAPAEAIPDTLPVEAAPLDRVPAPADLPVPAAADVLEVAAAEPFDAADAILIEPAFAPVPIMIGEMEEGEAYAELTLDQSFRGSDKDLAALRDIPEIYSLSINGAKLTDASLPHIAALPRLTTLNLRGTPFSAKALRQLRRDRPELSVICRSSGMLGINAGIDGPCVLTSVFFKSGAYDAGLRDGDEIVEVDGHKVGCFSDLTIAVYPHQPGDKVSVKYRRNDEEKNVEVTLKPRDAVNE